MHRGLVILPFIDMPSIVQKLARVAVDSPPKLPQDFKVFDNLQGRETVSHLAHIQEIVGSIPTPARFAVYTLRQRPVKTSRDGADLRRSLSVAKKPSIVMRVGLL